MLNRLNQFLDVLSEFLAQRKGLIPLIGFGLVLLNAILQFTSVTGWLLDSNLFLHVGILVAIVGFMLAWAL